MERQIVTVSRDSIEGLAEPEFVLAHEGKVYVTLAVLEYDPANLDEDQRAEFDQLQAMLEQDWDVTGIVRRGMGEPLESAQTVEQPSP